MSEANKAVVQPFVEEQDRLTGGPAETLCAPDDTVCIAGLPPIDLAARKHFSAAFYAAFPDLTHAIESVVAEGGEVAVCFTLPRYPPWQLHGHRTHGQVNSAVGYVAGADHRRGSPGFGRLFDQFGMLQQLGGPPPNGVSGVAIPSRRRGRVSARTPARCRCARSSAHASRR